MEKIIELEKFILDYIYKDNNIIFLHLIVKYEQHIYIELQNFIKKRIKKNKYLVSKKKRKIILDRLINIQNFVKKQLEQYYNINDYEIICNICFLYTSEIKLNCCSNKICSYCLLKINKCPWCRCIFNNNLDNIDTNNNEILFTNLNNCYMCGNIPTNSQDLCEECDYLNYLVNIDINELDPIEENYLNNL